MICVLSLNPCIDKTVALSRFELDSANRVQRIREDAGGKGMNVSRMARNLGADVRLIGFDFPHDTAAIAQALQKADVPHTLIPCPGALRVNLKIQDASRHATIEINEESAPIPPEKLTEMESTVLDALHAGDVLVLTGSLPKGAPVTLYRTLCEKAHEKGCLVAADCDGEALKEVLTASPDLIKPNRQELRKLLGQDPQTPEQALQALRTLMTTHRLPMVCHSRGGDGAMLITRDEAWLCPTLDVHVQGVYGAGDAMLAAVCHALTKNMSLSQALCYGVSASCATIELPGTQMGTPERTLALARQCTPVKL